MALPAKRGRKRKPAESLKQLSMLDTAPANLFIMPDLEIGFCMEHSLITSYAVRPLNYSYPIKVYEHVFDFLKSMLLSVLPCSDVPGQLSPYPV